MMNKGGPIRFWLNKRLLLALIFWMITIKCVLHWRDFKDAEKAKTKKFYINWLKKLPNSKILWIATFLALCFVLIR